MTDLTINEVVRQAGENSRDKGFHDIGLTFGDRIALIHSEASEALEAFRAEGTVPGGLVWYRADGKPEGIPSELADIIIRVADLAYVEHIDLADAVEEKMAYNAGRAHLHGGKRL